MQRECGVYVKCVHKAFLYHYLIDDTLYFSSSSSLDFNFFCMHVFFFSLSFVLRCTHFVSLFASSRSLSSLSLWAHSCLTGLHVLAMPSTTRMVVVAVKF